MTQNEAITAIIAASGWLVATLQLILGYFERKKQQDNEILLKTVEYFTGGSQKRSVGISLIEGLINKKENYSEIVVPLLTNQFVYLLLSTDSESAVHEERNLFRIYFLLKKIVLSDKELHWNSRNEILDAIERRLDNDEKSKINIGKKTLELWRQGLQY